MKKILLPVLLIASVLSGCYTTQMPAEESHETICLNSELDGSLTLRVWGTGRNRNDAVEQAKKNAVDEVIFKGVQSGNNSYQARPLIYEVNARERYQNYFNVFFADGGEYSKYVSMEDTKIFSNNRKGNRIEVSYGITVRVLVPRLKAKLIEDKIINP